MATEAHRQAWAQAQDGLRRELGDARYVRWIAPLRVLSEDGAEWRLGVASPSVGRWLEKNFSPLIRTALLRAQGEPVRVVFEAPVDGTSPCADARAGGGSVPVRRPVACAAAACGERGERSVATSSPPRGFDPAENGWTGTAREEADSAAAEAAEDLASFVVGRPNELAHNAVVQVARDPGGLYNPLFLHGPSGVGKSRLLLALERVLRGRARPPRGHDANGRPARRGAPLRVRVTAGERLFNEYVASIRDREVLRFRDRYRSLDVLLLDDLQGLIGKSSTQIELLHTLGALLERGAQVVVAADRPPRELSELEPTLMGRFLGGLVVGIGRPDYATRLGITRVLARRLGIEIGDDVIEMLARTLRGSACELSGALRQIDLQARVRGTPPTCEDARAAIADLLYEQGRRITPQRIAEVVAGHFGLDAAKLRSPGRERTVRAARDIAMHLSREHTRHSLAEIGAFFGGRRHGAVRGALSRVSRLLEADAGEKRPDLEQIRDSLYC